MNLSGNQVEALFYIEQVYFEKGVLPTDEVISDVIGISVNTVKSYWKDEDFTEALKGRGVNYETLIDDTPALNPKQLITIQMLLNTYDRRSVREKIKDIDVTTQQLNAWMQDPKFIGYLNKLAEKKFSDSDHLAYMSMVKNMENGDMSATKLFLEMRGKYSPRMDVNVNVDMIVNRVVEIVATHVKDPTVLAAIANDIERLETGVLRPVPELAQTSSKVIEAQTIEV